jgi:drug/metabolite transporter (DMT)-like permease
MTNSFFSPFVIFLIAGCLFVIIAKLLRVEKLVSYVLLAAVMLGLALYLTGYDKKLYRIIFEAPPVQPAGYPYLR